MYQIAKDKLRGVKNENGVSRTYELGDILPESFVPNQSWIDNGIVVKIENKKNKEVK